MTKFMLLSSNRRKNEVLELQSEEKVIQRGICMAIKCENPSSCDCVSCPHFYPFEA